MKKEVSKNICSSMPILIFIFGVFLLVAGCTETKHVTLVYPPERQAKDLSLKDVEGSAVSISTSQPIIILQFTDQRLDRVIATVAPRWTMVYLIAEKDVDEWVTKGVMLELERAGYSVTRKDSQVNSTSVPVLSGQIIDLTCNQTTLGVECHMSLIARMEKKGKDILYKRYDGKGSVLNIFASFSSYEKSLSLALADTIGSLIIDLKAILLEK